MKVLESDAIFIHEWIYDIVCAISYDRDYIYRSYSQHFEAIMNGIFNGFVQQTGEYKIMGIKSDYNAGVYWELPRRINYVGLNTVKIRCNILEKNTDKIVETHIKEFELSNGGQIAKNGGD